MTRIHLLSRATLVATLAVLSSLLLSACGGGAKAVDADDWIDEVCDAAKDYQAASDKAADKLFSFEGDDTAKGKKVLLGLVADNREASAEFRKAFDKAGKPDLKSGSAVVKAFKAQFDENDKNAAELKKLVEGIDVKKDFTEQFLEIAGKAPDTDFRGRLEDVADDEGDAQEIIDLIDDDPECAEVLFDDDAISDTGSGPTPARASTPAGSKPVSPPKTTNEKWVAGICTSLVGWVQNIEAANDKLQANLSKFDSSKDTPAALKQQLVDFLKTGQTETKNLKKEIDALKAPDVKDGAKIHQVFTQAGADLVKIFDQAVADSSKINASTYASVASDIDGFEEKILDAFDEVGYALDELDNYNAPDLEKAFESRPECYDLN